MRPPFVANLSQHLHADTDTQKRHTGANDLGDDRHQSEPIERVHAVARRSNPRKYYGVGGTQIGGLIRNPEWSANMLQRPYHRAQVSSSIIDNRDHINPYVE